MTTDTEPATLPAAAPTPHQLRLAGVELLDALTERLRDLNYTKVAIDTYADLATGHSIRHSYVAGTWTLSCGYDAAPRIEVRYSIHATQPDVEQLLNAVLPAAF